MKYIIPFIGVLLFISCASETEKKVLDDIAEVYNGNVSYSKSFVSNESEKRNTFNVFIENSKMTDSIAPTVTTSNTALLVYDAFTENEKNNYTDIEVFVVNKKKDTVSYYYPMDILTPISEKAMIFKEFSQRIIDKDFDKLDELKNNVDIQKSMAINIENGLKRMEKEHGSLKEYYRFGISEEKDEIGIIYQFQGYFVFSDGFKLSYLIVVDATKEKDKIVGYRFFN